MLKKLKDIFYESSRDPFPDFLRGLSIIFMIQVHITELLLQSDPAYYLFERWSYFFGGIPAAPVFIMLMGYYQDKSKTSFSKEILRGFKIFLLGLVLNVLMNLSLFYKYATSQVEIDVFSYLFGVDILLFAGLSYVLLAVLRRKIQKSYVFILIVLVIYLINYVLRELPSPGSIELKYLLSIFYKISDWSYFPLIPWFAYPIVGLVIHRTKIFEKFLEYKFPKLFWLIYFIVFFLTIEFGLKTSMNLDFYYQMNLDFFIYSLSILFGWLKFTNTIYTQFSDNVLVEYLRWLGRNVTVVYFFQWIIIGNTATYLYKSLTLNSCLIVFGIVIFSISICTYLYQISRS